MSTFLIRSATSPTRTSSYPIVLPISLTRPNPHKKFCKCRESNSRPHGQYSDMRTSRPMRQLDIIYNQCLKRIIWGTTSTEIVYVIQLDKETLIRERIRPFMDYWSKKSVYILMSSLCIFCVLAPLYCGCRQEYEPFLQHFGGPHVRVIYVSNRRCQGWAYM